VIEQSNLKRVVGGGAERSVVRSYDRAGVGDGDEMGLGEGEVQFLPIFAGRAELVPFVEVLRVSNLKSCLRFRVLVELCIIRSRFIASLITSIEPESSIRGGRFIGYHPLRQGAEFELWVRIV